IGISFLLKPFRERRGRLKEAIAEEDGNVVTKQEQLLSPSMRDAIIAQGLAESFVNQMVAPVLQQISDLIQELVRVQFWERVLGSVGLDLILDVGPMATLFLHRYFYGTPSVGAIVFVITLLAFIRHGAGAFVDRLAELNETDGQTKRILRLAANPTSAKEVY